METTLALNDRTIFIGPQHPFVIIGERINPTRRKKLAESMANGDFSLAQDEARAQVKAGAHVLDVNADGEEGHQQHPFEGEDAASRTSMSMMVARYVVGLNTTAPVKKITSPTSTFGTPMIPRSITPSLGVGTSIVIAVLDGVESEESGSAVDATKVNGTETGGAPADSPSSHARRGMESAEHASIHAQWFTSWPRCPCDRPGSGSAGRTGVERRRPRSTRCAHCTPLHRWNARRYVSIHSGTNH